ncbi:MAG: glycosyltransferase, partial [Candidatus Acidiferrales bacterium]
MRVLIAHNTYRESGGEDAVVAAEERILAENGHTVIPFRRDNMELQDAGLVRIGAAAFETIWASDSCRRLQRLIERAQPEVAHFHNTFPLISPAAYYVCQNARIPVVQTLHNYRLLCPTATFFRDGRVCQSCLGRSLPWPGILHGCYRDSHRASAIVAGMSAIHRALGTLRKKVNVYIALTEFARRQFIQGGLPPERIVVKHNCVCADPGTRRTRGEYAIFAGRMSPEKGILVLVSCWAKLKSNATLKIAGTGPQESQVASEVERLGISNVELLG